MGPWLCSHGNMPHCWLQNDSQPMLQWGRGCVATEMRLVRLYLPYHVYASMGPWLCSHGNQCVDSGVFPVKRLQWGRGCVATEIGRTRR